MRSRQPAYPVHEFRGLGPPLNEAAAGLRTDLFLSRNFPFRSRRAWRDICHAGQLLVNGVPVRASRRLQPGDLLAVWYPKDVEPKVDTNVQLLQENEGILALMKPGNLPMHESGFYWRHTLHAIVAARFGSEWQPMHRLDRETSGVVLFGACPELRRSISLDFTARRVRKTYLAIVRGEAAFDAVEVDAPIGADPTTHYPKGKVRSDGDPANTYFRVLDRRAGFSLLEATPKTGRYNQIRIHAAHLGLPIVGDKLYQNDEQIFLAYHRLGNCDHVQKLAGFPRHCLHAAAVELEHPRTGKCFRAEAAMPEDMQQFWHRQ